jgi:hypothetical protein
MADCIWKTIDTGNDLVAKVFGDKHGASSLLKMPIF